MLELLELLAGVGLAVAVIAGGWFAVSLILKSSGTGTDAMVEMLNGSRTRSEDIGERPVQDTALSV